MLSWLPVKLFSDSLSAGNMVLGKVMLGSVKDRRQYLFCVALVSIPFACIGLMLLATHISVGYAGLALLTGMAYILSGFFYYRALAARDALRLSLLQRMSPALTLVFSFILVHERLTLWKYLGFAMCLGAGFLTIEVRGKARLHIDAVVRDSFLSTALAAISSVLTALLQEHYSVWQTFSITRVGVVLGMLILVTPQGTWSAAQGFRSQRFHYSALLLLEQAIRLLALFIQNSAIAKSGSVTAVAVLSSGIPIYVWLLSSAVRKIWPNLQAGQKEGPSQQRWRLLLSLVLLILGAYLLALR